MSADLQQVKRPVIETRRINKYIVIPAFSLSSFWTERALKTKDVAIAGLNYTGFGQDLSVAFTIEMCLFTNFTSGSTPQTIFTNEITDGAGNSTGTQLKIFTQDGVICVSVYKAGVPNNLITESNIPVGTWFHLTVTYGDTAGGQTYLKVYIDGVEASTKANVAPPLDTGAAYDFVLCSNYDNTNIFYGYIDEVKVWNYSKSLLEVLSNLCRPSPADATGLLFYVTFDDASLNAAETLLTTNERVSDTDVVSDYSLIGLMISSESAAPIELGGSFVLAEYVTSLGKSVSLKYPTATPTDATDFALCVSWVDDNDIFQRRKIFGPSEGDIDLNPYPADYAGEKLPDGFKFEIVNVDGKDTAIALTDITLYLSDTTLPTSGTDHASIEAEVIAIDSLLAENFPLSAFPLAFNTQQTFE